VTARFELLKFLANILIIFGLWLFCHSLGTIGQISLFFVAITTVCLSYQKEGFFFPINFYMPFYFVYSISYMLYIYFIGGEDSFSAEIVPASMIGMLGFFCASFFLVLRDPLLRRKKYDLLESVSLLNISYVWLVFAGLCVLLSVYIFSLGLTSKREFLEAADSGFLSHATKIFIAFSLLSILFLMKIGGRGNVVSVKASLLPALLSFLVLMVGFGVTGERDFIFRFGFFVFAILFTFYYKFRYFYIVILLLLMLVVLPLMQSAKGFLLSGGGNALALAELADVFNNDFSTPSRIFHYLLQSKISDMNGVTYYWDFKRFLSPIFSQDSATAWFHNNVRPRFGDGGTSGWGFSFIGEAYINFGKLGVFFVFFFLGGVTNILYLISLRSVFWLLFYLLYMPTLIYILRADFANYLSLNFKVNLIIVMVLWFIVNPRSKNG